MKNTFLCLLLFSCLASTILAQMSILKPQGLREWWDRNGGETHTSIAAFGEIPWGKKVLGPLELAEPDTACDYIRTSSESSSSAPILIARRGECPFYLKAHFAQLAGAQMLVIVDNQYEEVESKLMVDSSGQGESIHIPSVLLAKKAGDKLIESLNSPDEKISDVHIVFDFHVQKSDKIDYNIWISSSNSQTFRFLRYWEPYVSRLGHVAEMQPHFLHFKMFGAPIGQDMSASNCVCGGKYCCTDPDGDLPNNGRDVLHEDLRQMCIINEYDTEAWWQYVKTYDESCLVGGSMLDCSKQIMNRIHVDSDRIINCVERSFVGGSDPDTCSSNRLLDAEEEYINKDGAFIFPSVFINGFMYRGNLVPGKGLFEAICESFNELPDVCAEHFDSPAGSPTYTAIPIKDKHWSTVLATAGFLVVFGLFVFCCYRRHLKREMYRQMVRDVNIAVSQYIAFKDEDVPRADEAD